MAQIINTNLIALNAQRNLNASQQSQATAIQRLSSGLRVNSAKDDAAGLAIAERMSTQVRGMNVAMRNANDGISFGQVAEGALGKLGDMAQRMRELAVQSANATNTSSDRANLEEEFKQLQGEIMRTINGTKFNGQAVLANATALTFQIGAGTDSTVDQIAITGTDMTATSSSVAAAAVSTISIAGTDAVSALAAISAIDMALTEINTQRANFGAIQNRFEAIINTLQVAAENQTAARSRIMDADFSTEVANQTRSSILQQAGVAMLSQANQIPQNVLQLLRG